MNHTFIREFGQFKATAKIAVEPEPHLTIEWEPQTPDLAERLRIRQDYIVWMLDNYKILAKEVGHALGYGQPLRNGKMDAWGIYPDGRVVMVMKNGKPLKPKR